MKTVNLEEKLNAQVKNIVAILVGENTVDTKIMLLEMQKDYLDAFLQNIIDQLENQN